MRQPSCPDLFRQRLAERIDLRHLLVVLSSRLPWRRIEAVLAPHFASQVRQGRAVAQQDLCGSLAQVISARGRGAGSSALVGAPDGQPAVAQARLQAH